MYSLSEVARLLGIDRHTVVDLARLNGVPIVPHPSNGKGKAVDEAGFQVLKQSVQGATVNAAPKRGRPRKLARATA